MFRLLKRGYQLVARLFSIRNKDDGKSVGYILKSFYD